MGEQTPPSAAAASSSSSPKELPTPNPSPVTTATISLRPRKTRKVSTSSSSSAAEDASKKTPSSTGRLAVRVVPRPLSADGEIAAALRHLRTADPHLARVIDAHEPPLFQCLHPPFHALARSILYQQLAFKAATSVYTRFLSLCGGEAGVVPEAVLALNPHQLRQIGVSGRKASYLHDLARKYHNGILSDAAIVAMDDKSLFTMLTMVKGIGAWSVHMFMIFSLHRPDVLPVGDLGVRKGVHMLYSLEDVPRPSQMEQLCERWRPYRSVGSWYMWRLGEARGAPTMATSSTEEIDIFAMGGGSVQQAQLIDPIQMLPSLG
ncbi:DNA-3-methyladenine glycosylase 1 [Musa acuminata AAA Group]|uniref:DNA-3-methyladenine glycosylase 1 n=1 Tax=Musa acuminata AAA Group TaxID=214697 RepID=UPI0031D52269